MHQQLELSNVAHAVAWLQANYPDDFEELVSDFVEGETDLFRLVARVHEQISRDAEMLVGIAERKAALAERQARIKARADGGKAFIGKCLRAAKLAKIELPEATYSVRDGKPTLAVVDADAVPDDYRRVKSEPDKAAINAAFADATDLPNWLVREAPRDVVTGRTR